MCGQKFELKIDNVRFVGHPTLLQHALGQVWHPRAGRVSPDRAFLFISQMCVPNMVQASFLTVSDTIAYTISHLVLPVVLNSLCVL